MRLSAHPTTCLASFCFATARSTAFVVCPVGWRVNPLPVRLQRTGCVRGRPSTAPRDISPTATMELEYNPGVSKRDTVRRAFAKILDWRRGALEGERQATRGETDANFFREGASSTRNQASSNRFRAGCRKGATWVRKGMAGVAAAAIIRTSFTVSSSSALPAPVSTRPKTVRQQAAPTEELDMAALELAVQEALAAETSVDGETATSSEEGEVEVEAEADTKTVPGVSRPFNRHERSEVLRAKLKQKGFNHNSVQRTRLPFNPIMALVKGAGAIFFYMSIVKGSVVIMQRQKKRVRVESNKFDQQRDEFMDVEGEAQVDVDIMKELRDLKEKMAGPGDSYAKETRAYNPQFADENPEEEYDAKLEELLNKRRKNNPSSSSTGRNLGDEGPKATARGDAQDDLLGDDAEEPSANSVAGGPDESDGPKDVDLKRLERLFEDSPNEDTDSPEDDSGDKRELLP